MTAYVTRQKFSDYSGLSLDELKSLSLDELMRQAARIRDLGHGNRISYSKKVFISLTHLCRDVCHYCTFARSPKKGEPYMSRDQVLEAARRGAQFGCKEALFTLGDKPELRYRAARAALTRMGYDSTWDYLYDMARMVRNEVGLLPHINAGVMPGDQIERFRSVSASRGLCWKASRNGSRSPADHTSARPINAVTSAWR